MTRHARVIVLSCMHTLSFAISNHAPVLGERAWCPRCGAYKRAVQAPRNFVVNCETCNRIRMKEYGDAPLKAETTAIKHSLRYAGHRVTVSDGEDVQTFHHPVMMTDTPPF